jgi:hypothetical protein
VSADLAEQIARAGQQIIASPASRIADELNRQLNQLLGWPFQASSGTAFDREGQKTPPFGTLIYTRVQGADVADGQPASVAADTLACAFDVTHRLDLEGLRRAYERVVHVKTLKKSPAAQDVVHTTITFGVVFAVESAVPLEHLANELHQLNQQTPSSHWPDMVVVASHGIINYAVQFPGEAVPWTNTTGMRPGRYASIEASWVGVDSENIPEKKAFSSRSQISGEART